MKQLDDAVDQLYFSGHSYHAALREFKKSYLRRVLIGNRGNQCNAAREMGMHRNTLNRTLTQVELDPMEVRGMLSAARRNGK